jgi:starch phosphorylase
MNENETWFSKTYPQHKDKKIAYFCAEFGVHESIPIYSGGLGVLAGDHTKSASDLGIPFIGVGLLYRQGYFDQAIDYDGSQKNEYFWHDFTEMPIELLKDENGEDIVIDVDIAGKKLFARAWKMTVGRVKIYLLDADIEQNTPEMREITYKLYGGGHDMRISQEILLGIGGVRLLKKLGEDPYVWHMNEGHSVFLALERIRNMINEKGLGFYEALEAVRANTLFTTHTPVPAGNDAFPLNLMEKYFGNYWTELKISRQQFMELGVQKMPEGFELFSLTILALKVAGRANGVSRLHGDVSSKLWQEVWKDIPPCENPITYVTNGVHTLSWMNKDMRILLNKYLGDNWHNNITDLKMWEKIDEIPDEELWEMHNKNKRRMIDYIRMVIKRQFRRYNFSQFDIDAVDTLMDENALIIGFARRFATYKRATLIFRNIERLKRIFNLEGKKIHIIFSGKAHPADKGGQALIKKIHEIARQEGFQGKIFFIENYSLHVARYMVRGVDVWLNNPRRPLEASGTSGQKVPVNGGVNFSILDGWWDEGYNGKNGFAINPDVITVEDDEEQADIDANSLYEVLEKEVIRIFYERENGLPKKWIKIMKESIKSVVPVFSTANMVSNYTSKLYVPCMESAEVFSKNDFEIAKKVASDKFNIRTNFSGVRVEKFENTLKNEGKVGEGGKVVVEINPGNLNENYLSLEFCVYDKNENVIDVKEFELKEKSSNLKYEIEYRFEKSGEFKYGIRIVPKYENYIHKYELGMAYWL